MSSNQDIWFLAYFGLYKRASFCDIPPQPKHLARSFPVPKGIHPIGHLLNEIPATAISSISHIMVPSPPPTITLSSTESIEILSGLNLGFEDSYHHLEET